MVDNPFLFFRAFFILQLCNLKSVIIALQNQFNLKQIWYNFRTKMAYRQIEGDRRGSILYVHNNFLYSNFRDTEAKNILRCREWRKSNCKGMGSIRKRDDVFTVMHDHSHDVEEKAVSVLEMKHEMKRRAETSNEPIRRIFDEVCATAPQDVDIVQSSRKYPIQTKTKRRTSVTYLSNRKCGNSRYSP